MKKRANRISVCLLFKPTKWLQGGMNEREFVTGNESAVKRAEGSTSQ